MANHLAGCSRHRSQSITVNQTRTLTRDRLRLRVTRLTLIFVPPLFQNRLVQCLNKSRQLFGGNAAGSPVSTSYFDGGKGLSSSSLATNTDGPTTVCNLVERSSTVVALPSVTLKSLYCFVSQPSQMYHQCEPGRPSRRYHPRCGRYFLASRTASGQSRSTSTSPPLGLPRSTPMFWSVALKYASTSSAVIARFCQPSIRGPFSPLGIGTTERPHR